MKARHLLAYVFLACAWGMSFFVMVKIVHAFGWVGAVTFRAFIAAGALFLAARLFGIALRFSAHWAHFLVVGASTVALQLIGFSYATPQIGTAMAAIIAATIPLFSMVIAQAWGLERTSKAGFAGLAMGFAGLVLLVGFPTEPMSLPFLFNCVILLGATLAAAFGSNYANRFLKGVGSSEVTMAAFFWGGVLALPLLLLVPVPTVPAISDYLFLVLAGGGDEWADLHDLFLAGVGDWRDAGDQRRVRRHTGGGGGRRTLSGRNRERDPDHRWCQHRIGLCARAGVAAILEGRIDSGLISGSQVARTRVDDHKASSP